jgi:hypothetical protein
MNVETVNCSPTYRSFETGTNGDDAAPYCVTRSIHVRATRVTTTLTTKGTGVALRERSRQGSPRFGSDPNLNVLTSSTNSDSIQIE